MTNWIEGLHAPLFVSWQLTRDCDLACLHCCTDSAPGKSLPDELNAEEALRLAGEIIRAKVGYVMLCGGEPLRAAHFFAVASRLGEAGIQLKIETNGQMLDDAAVERLARLPIRSIQISLDADTEEIYRCQRPGSSLAKTHAACRAVRAAGLPLEVTFAPTRLNIGQIDAVIERARSFGAFRFNTGRLMHIGRAARLWHKIAPTSDMYDRFEKALARQIASNRAMGDIRTGRDAVMEIRCDPWTVNEGLHRALSMPPATLLILPNGWVKVAGALRYVCGDLRQMALTEVWAKYRVAWHNESVTNALHQGIVDESYHGEANDWIAVPDGGKANDRVDGTSSERN